MFTWICPQCGREVPPAYNSCPDCDEKAKQAGEPGAAAQPPQQAPVPPPPMQQPPAQQPPPQQQSYYPPPQQQYGPPQQYAQHGQPQYAPQPPHYQQPPHRGLNLPIWLMTILFALATGGVVMGVLWILSTNRGSAGSGPRPSAIVESPAARPGSKTNPLQKYIEISGVRFVQDAKKNTMAKFVIINHSDSDINGLAGNVTIWGRTQKSEEDAQGTFTFSTNLGPMETQELTVPLKTKLKIYELPDWQNITTDIQITAPPA
jgi:hypothetical protein